MSGGFTPDSWFARVEPRKRWGSKAEPLSLGLSVAPFAFLVPIRGFRPQKPRKDAPVLLWPALGSQVFTGFDFLLVRGRSGRVGGVDGNGFSRLSCDRRREWRMTASTVGLGWRNFLKALFKKGWSDP